MSRRTVTALKLGTTGVFFFVIAQRVDLSRVWEALATFPVSWLPAIVTLLALSLIISSLKWKVILRTLGQPIGLFEVLRLFWVGLFFNTFLPGRTGGDAVRAYGLPKTDGSRSRAIASVIIDRGVNLLALVVISVVATFLDARLPIELVHVVRGLAGVCVGTILILAVLRNKVRRNLPEKIAETLPPNLSALWELRNISLVAGLALAFQMIMILINVCAAHALDTQVSTTALFVAIPLAALITAIPVSINGVGIREAAYATLLSLLGAPPEHGVALSVTVTAANICWSMIGGIFYAAESKSAQSTHDPSPSSIPIVDLS